MSDPVIAAAPQGVLTTDDAGSILAANSKAEQLFESRAWELVGRPLADLLSPSFEQLLGARGNWVEVTATRLDGTEFPAEVALSQLEELPVRYAVWIRDLPRSARRESPIRRAALFDATEIVGGVGGWEFTPSENTLRWSRNLYRLFGYEPGEIIPSPQIVYASTHPDDRERSWNVTSRRLRRVVRRCPSITASCCRGSASATSARGSRSSKSIKVDRGA